MGEAFIEVGGMAGEYFTRNKIFPLEQRQAGFQKIIQMCNNTDVYYCTYVFDKKDRKEGTRYYSPLYFDIDGDISTDKGFEELRMAVLSLASALNMELRVKQNEMKFYFSGSKGFHILIPPTVLGIKPHTKLNMLYKVFVLHMQQRVLNGKLIDTRIYDNKRLIRMPNTINAKTGKYKIPVSYNDIQTLTREELLAKASTPQPEVPTSGELNQEAAARLQESLRKLVERSRHKSAKQYSLPTEMQKLPICMKEILNTPVSKGGRNNTLAMIASVLVQNGYVGDTALSILHAWNSNNDEPLPGREVDITYASAEKGAREGKRYGCTSIREQGCFAPREICPKCRIFQKQQQRGN